MEMHQVRYFLAVAEVLNFTRAAEQCQVAQPSLTRAIKLLEAELGADLFRRERNLTHLTEFGRRMLPLLRQCLDSATSAKRLATSYKRGAAASLTLAVSLSVSLNLLAGPLHEMMRAFPGLDLKILRGHPAQIAEQLKKGDASLAIAGSLDEDWERLDRWPLLTENFDAIMPGAGSGEAISLRDLSSTPFIARRHCEQLPAFDSLLRDASIEFPTRHEVWCDADVLAMAEAAWGFALLPQSTPHGAALQRRPLADPTLTRTISLYVVAGRERPPAADAVLKLFRAKDWSRPLH